MKKGKHRIECFICVTLFSIIGCWLCFCLTDTGYTENHCIIMMKKKTEKYGYGGHTFLILLGTFVSYRIKTLPKDCTAADRNHVTKVTCRRQRSSQASSSLI